MKWFPLILCLSFAPIILWSGCGFGSASYSYRAITENCQCEEYRAIDRQNHVEYYFRANYAMHNGVATNIEIKFINDSKDTLFLDPGVVKVTSRNISYLYNDKFLPLVPLVVRPSRSETVYMIGVDMSQTDDWNKIAGEQLTVILKGVRLGLRPLPPQSVTFIPENPRLKFSP